MALIHSYDFKGISISDGYVKVSSQYGTKDSLTFMVDFAKSSTDPVLFSQSFSCTLDLNGPNPIKQAYEYLKTLPEFADAVDC